MSKMSEQKYGSILAVSIAASLFVGTVISKIEEKISEKNLDNLEQLADIDNSGFLDIHEKKEMYEACGVELVLNNGVPTHELTNKQMKRGIERYYIRDLI